MQNGDFRSPECVELLKESDIVVTNPPFSQFRDYVAQLMEYGKKFIIIGNMNAVTYKEFFPLIKNNKVWPGYIFNSTMLFGVPDTYTAKIEIDSKKYVRVPAICWYTNLDHPRRHEPLTLFRSYSAEPERFPKYDNYDAINVDKTADIPVDYDGIMGVPISFLDKYCPEQFEILGLSRDVDLPGKTGMKAEFVKRYFEQGNTGQIMEGHPDLCYYDKNGKAVVPYRRVMIQRRKIYEY